jgi:hypothetical protein
LLVLAILAPTIAFVAEAADDSSTQHVLVEGVGRTADEAQNDAWRNAVSQVVGTIVDTETLVKNDQLINDQVLTYSRGYIERFSKLSQTELGGLFRVKIDAWVKKTSVMEKLVAIQVLHADVDGGSIAAQLATRQENSRNASGLLLKALSPFLRAQHIRIARVTQGQIDVRADGASIAYDVELALDDAVFQRLRQQLLEVLQSVGSPLQVDVPSDTIREAPNTYSDLVRAMISFPIGGSDYRKEARERASDFEIWIQSGGELNGYRLERSILPLTWIRSLAGLLGVKVRVRLLDAQDAVVATSRWTCLPTPSNLYPTVAGCPTWDIRTEEKREIQGRVGEELVGNGGSRLLIGITDLVSPRGPSYNAPGVVGASITVKLPVTLTGEQARRVVRAEAQVVPFPDMPKE